MSRAAIAALALAMIFPSSALARSRRRHAVIEDPNTNFSADFDRQVKCEHEHPHDKKACVSPIDGAKKKHRKRRRHNIQKPANPDDF